VRDGAVNNGRSAEFHRFLGQQAPRTLGVVQASIDEPDPTQLRRSAVLGGIIHEYQLVA
jgi:hypothetical protein